MRKYAAIAPRMAKGRTVSGFNEWNDEPLLPHLTVVEAEDGIYDTGLIDPYGRAIYSFPEKAKIGFTSHLGINE